MYPFCYFLDAALDVTGVCYIAQVFPIFNFAKPSNIFLALLVIIYNFLCVKNKRIGSYS